MPGTRASSRLAGKVDSSPNQADKASNGATGEKRKASNATSPAQKRGRKTSNAKEPKEQKTIEETMDVDVDQNAPNDAEMKEVAEQAEQKNNDAAEEKKNADMASEQATGGKAEQDTNGDGASQGTATNESAKKDHEEASSNAQEQAPPANDSQNDKNGESTGESTAKKEDGQSTSKNGDVPQTTTADSTGKIDKHDEQKDATDAKTEPSGDGAVEVSAERKEAMPSNILEKGIIYFFIRARVGVDDPSSVQDVARSFIVLRPLPQGAKIGDGNLEDTKNNRLLALPKKVLPKSSRDVFMSFVEKAGVTIKELKEDFMKGSDYDTKTTGVSHSPPVTPIGEGVYALTTTGRDSHLAYMLTIPSELGEVQKEMGLNEKGSFALSAKNPARPGPANTNLDQGPDFPKEIMEEFNNRGWAPLQPKHLEYAHAQFILIGEGQGDFGKALDADAKDKKDDSKETPLEELEKLESEDEHRVEALKGDDSIFDDLGLARKEFPALATTW